MGFKSKRLVLKEKSIKKYWNDLDSESLSPILNEMDSKETWVVNTHPAIIFQIHNFAHSLNENFIPDEKFREYTDSLIIVLAYINTSWCLRFLKWLEERKNSSLTKLIFDCSLKKEINYYDEDNDEDTGYLTPNELILDRMIAIKNLNMIQKIFNPERCSSIYTLLSEYETQSFAQDSQEYN